MVRPDRYRKGGRVHPRDLPKGPNGRALCRWCGRETRPPRRTFCSADCVHQHKLRTNASYAKKQVYLRDKGICCACGTDTKLVARDLLEIYLTDGPDEVLRFKKLHGIPAKRRVWKRKYGGGLWDMDHTLSVCEGGGQCGTDGLQTLCIPCHRDKTRELRARITR